MRAIALALVALAAYGCGGVSPYEREDLTRPAMNPEREAQENTFRGHVQESREGASGGHGSAGGGCGCN